MNRRDFLIRMGMLYSMTVLPAFAETASEKKRLIVIFLRGAVDGLNVIVPTFEQEYYDNRPGIAIRNPIALDQGFGANPALSPLMNMWEDGELSFHHACGLMKPNRSHFEAQALIERGVSIANQSSNGGWMGRLGTILPNDGDVERMLSITPSIPIILEGAPHVATFELGKRVLNTTPMDRLNVERAFETLYSGSDRLSIYFRDALKARKILIQNLQKDMELSQMGSVAPAGFATDAAMLGRMMHNDPKIQSVFLSIGGWDTHINQGSDEGPLSKKLSDLATGLKALKEGLGDSFKDTLILTLSEFGRTVRENGTGGTDHGHGNVVWMMGGGVNGKRVNGVWPGLAEENLSEGRDLAVTEDYRQVLGKALQSHFNLNKSDLGIIFPG